jgi:hypothetical protein
MVQVEQVVVALAPLSLQPMEVFTPVAAVAVPVVTGPVILWVVTVELEL